MSNRGHGRGPFWLSCHPTSPCLASHLVYRWRRNPVSFGTCPTQASNRRWQRMESYATDVLLTCLAKPHTRSQHLNCHGMTEKMKTIIHNLDESAVLRRFLNFIFAASLLNLHVRQGKFPCAFLPGLTPNPWRLRSPLIGLWSSGRFRLTEPSSKSSVF